MFARLQRTGVKLFMILMMATLAMEFAGCKSGGAAPGTRGNTTIYSAAASGSSRERAQILIDRGQDVNERNPEKGWTPLHVAAANGHPKMVQFLLDNGAEVNAKSNNGSTPLHLAMGGRHSNVVSTLLMNGADRSIRNDLGVAAGDAQ